MKCLNQDPKIKACYATGAGCLVPEELVEPAKEVCKAWITNKNIWKQIGYSLILFIYVTGFCDP